MKRKGIEVRPEDVEASRERIRESHRYKGMIVIAMGLVIVWMAFGFQRP
jgi:hypothetical protein